MLDQVLYSISKTQEDLAELEYWQIDKTLEDYIHFLQEDKSTRHCRY
jgi:hypothetical protein